MSLTTNLIKNFVLFLNSIFTFQTRLVCKTKKKNKDIVTVIAERNPGTSILPWHAIVDYFSTGSQEVFFFHNGCFTGFAVPASDWCFSWKSGLDSPTAIKANRGPFPNISQQPLLNQSAAFIQSILTRLTTWNRYVRIELSFICDHRSTEWVSFCRPFFSWWRSPWLPKCRPLLNSLTVRSVRARL